MIRDRHRARGSLDTDGRRSGDVREGETANSGKALIKRRDQVIGTHAGSDP